eukprot:CAMPEP_0194564804 /NCGR_PEP_ID=MMETSP0292-20121207/4312_1 /TAXON_ID=39354 /ORGANISM="Heterosigma akashiwo, Strain CCMP2393" /LENGTH=39 /DNA_ID= /DNA_START= /DNA_END= /DNA_ORIENTATION=
MSPTVPYEQKELLVAEQQNEEGGFHFVSFESCACIGSLY